MGFVDVDSTSSEKAWIAAEVKSTAYSAVPTIGTALTAINNLSFRFGHELRAPEKSLCLMVPLVQKYQPVYDMRNYIAILSQIFLCFCVIVFVHCMRHAVLGFKDTY